MTELEVKLITLLEDICEEKTPKGDYVYTYRDIALEIIELFEKDLKKRVEELKQEDWQKPLSKEDMETISYGIMSKCLDEDKLGGSKEFLLRILYHAKNALKREEKLVNCLKGIAGYNIPFADLHDIGRKKQITELVEYSKATLKELNIE